MSFSSVGRGRSISSRSRFPTSISFAPTSGQTPRRLLFAVLRDPVGFLGSELDARHVGEAHDRAAPFGDDQFLELVPERRSVFASRLTCTRLLFVWPTAARKLLRCRATCTSPGERLSAASHPDPPHGDLASALALASRAACRVRSSQSVMAGTPRSVDVKPK